MADNPFAEDWESSYLFYRLSPNNPEGIATAFLEKNKKYVYLFSKYHNKYYRFHGYWQIHDIENTKRDIFLFLKEGSATHEKLTPKTRLIDEIEKLLRYKTSIDYKKPIWLNTGIEDKKSIAFKNKIFIRNKNKFINQTPEYFTPHTVPHNYNEDAGKPVLFLKFLDDILGSDNQAKNTIWQMISYLLSSDTSYEKCFLIIGPPRSGKGTLCSLINHILGEENVCSPTLNTLSKGFGAESLINKSLATINDVRFSKKSDSAVALEILLSVIGQDTLSIDRKYSSFFSDKLNCRFILCSNELPKLYDSSNAIIQRTILIHLLNSYFGYENFNLKEELKSESEEIIKYALPYLEDLHNNNGFLQPESGKDLLNTFKELTSPIETFVNDCCDIDVSYECIFHEMYEAWKAWNEDQGVLRISSKQMFSNQLKSAVSSVQSRQKNYRGKNTKFFYGIRLKSIE